MVFERAIGSDATSGTDGIEGLREMEPEENEVAVVDVDDERERAKLDLVEVDWLDWLEKREFLLAKLSNDDFFVCEGALCGIFGASLIVAGSFWPGAVK